MTKSAAQILGLRITRVTVMRPTDSDTDEDSEKEKDEEDTGTESRSEEDPPLEDLFDALGDFFSSEEDEAKKEAQAEVYTWIPTPAIDEIRKHGLLSGEQLLNKPKLLALAAEGRKETPDSLRDGIQRVLTGFKPDSARGVNVSFKLPPTNLKFPSYHPLNSMKLTPVAIDLARVLKDHKKTRIHGQELMPYREYEKLWTKEQLDNDQDDPSLRHRDLNRKELKKLLGMSADQIWSGYRPDEVGRYAPDVPHAAVITPTGRISPRYIRFLTATVAKTAEVGNSEDKTTKPILITGHSGAGKSTVASKLSEKLGLPVTHVDHDPDWRAYTDSSDWETISRLDPDSAANERYHQLRRNLAERVLKQNTGVIEGTQLLSRPDLATGHDVVLVDPSERAVVRRRLQRDRLKALDKNRTYPEPGGALARLRADMARVIGSLHRDEVERFRELPGVNRITGIRDPRLNRLIEILRKNRT